MIAVALLIVMAAFSAPALASGPLTQDQFRNWPELPEYTLFNPFPGKGANCTWYAHGRMFQLGFCKEALDTMRFNAYTWADTAGKGAMVVSEPSLHSIAFWESGAFYNSRLGHVGVVEAVNDAGHIQVSDSGSSGSPYRTYWLDPDSTRWPTAFIVVPKATNRSARFAPGSVVHTTATSLNFRFPGLSGGSVLLPKDTPVRIEQHASNGLYAAQPGGFFAYHNWWYASAVIEGEIKQGWLAERYLTPSDLPFPPSGTEPTPIDQGGESGSPESGDSGDSAEDGAGEKDPQDPSGGGEQPAKPEDSEQTPTDGQRGDLTGDGMVNVADAVILSRHILQISLLDARGLGHADLNGDGVVDIRDLVLLVRLVLESP